MNNKYYRITYNGKGIYEAFREMVSMQEWKTFLSLKEVNWLPKPPSYDFNNKSYFKDVGYNKFCELVLPLMLPYLDKKNIEIDVLNSLENIVYEDECQVVVFL